jgi:hypothetical protein
MNITLNTEDGWIVEAYVETKSAGFNGIGHYEYWGSTGFDKGVEEIEIESITIESANDPDGNDVDLDTISEDQKKDWEIQIEDLAIQEL